MLFELDNDPYELNNRLNDPACEPLRGDLLARLTAWDHDVRGTRPASP
jgi:hypothetical protein